MGIRILLVDDEEILRDNLARFFTRKGLHSTQANSGNEALALLKQDTSFDLIISDMRMNDGDGHYLYLEAKKINHPAKFIFLTGFSEIPEEELTKLNDVLFVENKPVDKKLLLQRIQSHFE